MAQPGKCGANNAGTIFKVTTGGAFTTVYSFCQDSGCVDGQNPLWLARGRDGNFYGTTYNGGTQGVGTIFKITPAGFLTTLYSFCSKAACVDGSHPRAGLARVPNSDDFFGTTYYGGSKNVGTVFRIASAGRLAILHNFHGPDGEHPVGGVLALRGVVYGTTAYGGSANDGTIFRCKLP